MRAPLAAALAMCVLCGTARAGELRIIDEHGLVRALAEIRGTAEVTIEIDPPPAAAKPPLLTPLSGLGAAIEAEPAPDGAARFSGVNEGSWRIVLPAAAAVRRIEVRDAP